MLSFRKRHWFSELEYSPYRADNTNWDVYEKHQSPRNSREQSPDDRAEEEPRGKRDPIHAQAKADISPAECIGHDRRTVGDEERAAHGLHHAVDH